MAHYHVIQTYPKAEKAAAEWLETHLDLEVFYPIMKKLIKPRKQKSVKPIEVTTPVFSGYLFVYCETYLDWFSINSCHHIYGYLCNNGVPAPISIATIDAIRERVKNGDYDQLDPDTLLTAQYSKNEAVLITPGDVTMLGKVIEIRSRHLRIEVDAVGGPRSFVVPVNDVTPAKILIQSANM